MNGQCVTQTVWYEATNHLNSFLDSLTLQTLCERGQDMGVKRESDHRFMYYI
jgi:DNA-binding IscR family transcriptional regulator